MSNQTQQATASELEAPKREPAIFLLAELSWGDDAYGENLPVAGLIRVTKITLQKVDHVAMLIQDGVISKRGAGIVVPAADVAWLTKVCFTEDNTLAAVPEFFDPEKDRVLYMCDVANMDLDGIRADFGDVCQKFVFSDQSESELSGLHMEECEGKSVRVTGVANGFSMGGYFEPWPILRERIAAELEKEAPTQ